MSFGLGSFNFGSFSSGSDSSDGIYNGVQRPRGPSQDESEREFARMVRDTEYGQEALLDTPGNYDVYLMKGGQSGLHWSLLVRMNNSRKALPFLSIEVNTDATLSKLIPTMRQFENAPEAAKRQGYARNVSLMQLCKLADRVKQRMCIYNLAASNCQDFCNNILKELGFSTHTTTAKKAAVAATVAYGVGTMCNVM